MPLFQESIVRKYLGTLNPEVVDQAYARFKEVYSINKINNIKVAKEEQYQEGFIKDIFGTVLGYSLFPEQPFNIQTELKNVSDSKKADGAIFQGENVIGVIELKDNKTKNLDAVKDQAFGYKNNHKDCSYVISSNFHKLRFYVDDATEYEEFDLYSLDKDTFKRLYLFLSKEKLLDANTPKILRQETKFQEENITKSLYKDYSSFKNSFFDNVVKNNPQHDKLLLFKKSQKFLDKVLFVLFAEDKGLVTTNSIVQIVEKWQSLQNDAFDTPKPLYQLVVLFFNNLFVGKKDQKGNVLIPEFGGEVFAPDEVLDALIVDDSVLHTNLLKLTKYDFNTDVDVNILGHIFEHSLSEIEEVEASLKGEIADKTKGKRKKDGVFYTPKYITKYIVENTVGKLCAEKKAELQLDIDIAVHEHQKADGKLNAKGVELYETLTRYKEWLLTLKIVDPACGSGAFLNQALNFLIEEHRFADDLIAELTNTPLRLFDTDIAILENNIYGVDINEESIEIAKLSLWLRTAKPGRKLSNLNNNIKCGNSLIDDPTVAGTKAFNWHKEFADVFANGGFDVVIGNPPYVVYLKSTVGKGTIEYVLRNYNFAEYNPNTYSLFTELSLKILKKGGQIGFIIPNTWMHNKYFSRMRHSVYQFQVNEIVYLKNTVFKEIVETVVLLLENSARYSSRIKLTVDIINVNSTINDFEYEKYRSGYNPFEENNDVIVEKMDLIDKLSKHVVIYRGLETRDNEKWIANTKIDNQYKPILLGKDVSKYNTVYSGSYVNFIKEAMKSNANEEYYYQDKILMRRTGSFIVADLDFTKSLALKNLYLIIPNDKRDIYCIISQLNSKLFDYYHKAKSSGGNKAFAQFSGEYIASFPCIVHSKENDKFRLAVERIQSLKKALKDTTSKLHRSIVRKYELDIILEKLQDWYQLSFAEFIKELAKKKIKLSLSEEAEWEDYFTTEAKKALELQAQIDKTDKEIDQMVYKLYQLTDEEIKIVEGAV